MNRRHGVARLDAVWRVHFGIALWPYDLALRFSYDLPENEHLWADEWFDDRFETAALDIRASAAKLLRATRAMDVALNDLRESVADPPHPSESLRDAVESAPLALDLVAHYLSRILNDAAAIIPHCYGQRGKALAADRTGLLALLSAPALAELDPDLPTLLQPGGALPSGIGTLLEGGPPAHRADLYVVADSAGFAASLPRAAQRALRANAEVTLDAGAQLDGALRETCAWFDALLAHLIETVCQQSQEGPDLRDRWSRRDWSVLQELDAPDTALERRMPAV